MSKIKEDFLSVRSAITLGGFFLAYVLMFQGKPVPELLSHILDILLGFWFGQKIANALQKKGGNDVVA